MGKKNYYAIARGRNPGIYTSWPEAKAQVDGYPQARYKGFATREEALNWLHTMQGTAPPPVRRTAVKEDETSSSPPQAAAPTPHAAALAAGEVVLYADGGADPNPGPGGYGAVLLDGGERRELSSGFRRTTNNRMELMGVIAGLESLLEPRRVAVFSDSLYLINAIQKGWARHWRRSSWLKKDQSLRENADLWNRLLKLLERHQVSFHWVRGHSGLNENERCDRLASAAARQPDLPPDTGYESPSNPAFPSLFE